MLPVICLLGIVAWQAHSRTANASDSIGLENVKSGDADYPAKNAHPTRTLLVRGVLPPTLQIQFLLHYTADEIFDVAGKPSGYCGYQDNEEASEPFFIVEPLEIVRTGSEFHGSMTVDKYLPGRCNWHFDSIGYKVLNSTGDLTQDWIGLVYDAKRDQSRLKFLHPGPVVEWCKTNTYVPTLKRPEICSALPALQLVLQLSPEFVGRIPLAERESEFRATIFPETTVFEIQFRDLDAIPNAMVQH